MSGKKDCKFCDKKGLLWLPLRYSAVGVDTPDAISSLPTLSGKLGKGVTDLALTKAKYAVRLLRPGYLYVLLERKGIKYWEAYMVLDDAFLYKFSPEDPPQAEPPFNCEPYTCGVNASMVAIPEAKDVPKLWALFTPSPLTRAKLAEYKANADKYAGEGKMQTFSPADWLAGSTAQPHTLLAPELLTKVAEYVLFTQPGNPFMSPLGKALKQQLFPASTYAYVGAPRNEKGEYLGRLGGLYHAIKRNGYAAMALYDHIGVTQELNNFRNAALEPVELFLAKEDAEKVNNQRRLEVMQAIDDVEAGFIKHGIGVVIKQIQAAEARPLPNVDVENAKTLRALGRTKEAEELEARAKRSNESREKNRQIMLTGKAAEERWKNKYKTLLNTKEIDLFRQTLERISVSASAECDQRVPDHVSWLTSERLIDAFDTYDPEDLGSGFCFTQEHLLCTFGMFGSKKNTPLLKAWMNVTKVERKNLYMRTNLFNQKALQEEATKAFAEARQQVAAAEDISHVAGAPLLKAAKGLIDLFKKADSAWDEWLRDKVVKGIHKGEVKPVPGSPIHNLSKFHRSAEGLLYARISEWAQALSTSSGKMDKGISAVVGMLLYSKLGDLAEKIGFDEFLLKIKAEKIAELRAKTQKTAEYQARADQQKQTAKANVAKAEQAAKVDAAAQAKVEAEAVDGSIKKLIEDEQAKVKRKVKLTLEDLDKGLRPETNNFRQARMGVLLMSIEGLALAVKSQQVKTPRVKAEITASMLSLTAMAFDMVYAVAKSIREIQPYEEMVGVNKAADVMRGGLKMTAGGLSAAAGGISAALDICSLLKETRKDQKDWILMSVYFSRSGVGLWSLGLGLIAAFSYCGPLLLRMAGSQLVTNSMFALRLTNAFASSAAIAKSLADARTLWLIRVARFNLIGLAITAAEIGYYWFIKDDELENWCQACSFRKDKSKGFFSEKPYPDVKKELEELEKAFKAVTI